jgi:hypothetical protein
VSEAPGRHNIDAIGLVFKVHRATVARWLLGIRGGIAAALRQRVGAQVRPTSTGFRSALAVIRDDLTVSLGRVIGPRSDG